MSYRSGVHAAAAICLCAREEGGGQIKLRNGARIVAGRLAALVSFYSKRTHSIVREHIS